MTTQYTTILKLALPVQGELSGTWGDVVNNNITQMVEQAVAGKATVNSWTGNSHTLTSANGTTAESRCAILELTDTGTALSGVGTVICPAASKLYIVDNNTARVITVKTASGSGVAVPVGKTMLVYCDGTNVVEGVTHANSLSLGTSTTTASSILDEDNMASNSATALSTQQSIKAYVDAQVDTVDTLAEVLAIGNTTGGTDIATTTTDKVQFRDAAIYINSSVDGQLDIVADTEIQIAATTVDLNGNLDVSGTALVTGVLTTTATQVATGGITSGSDIISDTDSTDSLGSTAVRWLKGWFDTLTAGTLTIGSGSVTDSSGAISFGNENLTTTGTATAASLALATGATVTGVDNGTLGTSATLLATQGAIKTYVDAQVDTADSLSEILAIGNTTGGTDIAVTTSDDITFADSSKAIFGVGSDLQIYHDGSNSWINDTSGTGNLYLASNQLIINNSPNNENMARFAEDGSVTLYHNGLPKIATTSTGIDVTGTVTATGTSVFASLDISGDIDVDGTTNLDAVDIDGTVIMAAGEHLELAGLDDGEFLNVYTAGILDLAARGGIENYSDTNNNDGATAVAWRLHTGVAATGSGGAGVIATIDKSGKATFAGSLALATGATVTGIDNGTIGTSATLLATQGAIKTYVDAQVGTVDTLAEVLAIGNTTGGTDIAVSTSDDITFADSSKAIFGAGSDLQIYHDGSHSYISDQGTGNLRVLAENFQVRNPANNEAMIIAIPDSGVNLYHDNSAKLATTVTGIDVVGTATMDGLTVDGTFQTPLASFNSTSGYGRIALQENGVARMYMQSLNGADGFKFMAGDGTSERMRIDASGNVGIGTASPSSYSSASELVVDTGVSGGITIVSDSTTGGYGALYFADGTTGNEQYRGFIQYNHNNGGSVDALAIGTSGTEQMRIDASGNVLVGTTNTLPAESNVEGIALSTGSYGGLLSVSRAGNRAATFNRTTSDGDITQFRKDGVTVGSIGTVGGVLTIGNGDTGLLFSGSGDYITPRNATTQAGRDAAIDLGTASDRFKDIHLSGTATTSALLSAKADAGANAFSAGPSAGQTAQGASATAVGYEAGETTQGANTTAVGRGSGNANQGLSATAVGYNAGNATQGNYAVAMGYIAGQTTQGDSATAVGRSAGTANQGISATAIGYLAGNNAQSASATAIGLSAGTDTQGDSATAIGRAAGKTTQGASATAIGYSAGQATQGANATAVGYSAGKTTQGDFATAVGYLAGTTNQSIRATAVGREAGETTQGIDATAVGYNAGNAAQGLNATAVGSLAGTTNQGIAATALGRAAGNSDQGDYATALGYAAGQTTQGLNSVAIGRSAGKTNQAANGIIISSTGAAVDNTTAGHIVLESTTHKIESIAGGGFGFSGEIITATLGTSNLVLGAGAGAAITSGGDYNVFVGDAAGGAVTTGEQNTLIGGLAGDALTDADNNVAIGYAALTRDTLGSKTVAIGQGVLANQNFTTATDAYNVAVGHLAGAEVTTGEQNTLIGGLVGDAITTANGNSAVGYNALGANTTGSSNVAIGTFALVANTTASLNTAVGYASLSANTTGGNNTAVGYASLSANITGDFNVASGMYALYSNTTASFNTASGYQALRANTTGASNVASGFRALYSNTTGGNNTASGKDALYSNTTGANNTGLGYYSLISNTTGANNTASGYAALYSNTTGANNVASGYQALYSNTTGGSNVASGVNALYSNTTGAGNVAVGRDALLTNITGVKNVAAGNFSLRYNTGDNNTAVGHQALDTNTTASNNAAYGYRALYLNTTGASNVALGAYALDANTTAGNNTAVGYASLGANTTGTFNTALGRQALLLNTTADNNVAVGGNTLFQNTTGADNVAVGAYALDANTTASNNTAIGKSALTANTTGANNVASGASALSANTTGSNNVASGASALYSNTAGSYNTASGFWTLYTNTTGVKNTATGYNALRLNTTGLNNTASGYQTLFSNTTGANNTASGMSALKSNTTGANNTAVGYQVYDNLTTGDNNVAFGYDLSASAVGVDAEITIGVGITGGGTNTVRIGTAGGTATLGLDGSDTSWAAASDVRLKKDILDSTAGLAFVNELRPVTFKWNNKDAIDSTLPQYDADDSAPVFGEGNAHHGFIAQEVKAVIDNNPDVVNGHNIWQQDPDGTQQVAPSALVPMLVKAIQEQSALIEALTARITTLEG